MFYFKEIDMPNPPLEDVWYFTPADGNGMVTAYQAQVTAIYLDGRRDVAYTDSSQAQHSVTGVQHGTNDYQPNKWRSTDEAGEDVVNGGMSSSR